MSRAPNQPDNISDESFRRSESGSVAEPAAPESFGLNEKFVWRVFTATARANPTLAKYIFPATSFIVLAAIISLLFKGRLNAALTFLGTTIVLVVVTMILSLLATLAQSLSKRGTLGQFLRRHAMRLFVIWAYGATILVFVAAVLVIIKAAIGVGIWPPFAAGPSEAANRFENFSVKLQNPHVDQDRLNVGSRTVLVVEGLTPKMAAKVSASASGSGKIVPLGSGRFEYQPTKSGREQLTFILGDGTDSCERTIQLTAAPFRLDRP